jgi:long-chain-fatty-acid--CoA ligase ACSBG
MLSHDALTWNAHAFITTMFRSKPELVGPDHRSLSYLPLSHIAGYQLDVLVQLYCGFESYFARPDALAGTLGQSLLWAKPTMFFGVPRIWEKFELTLKDLALLPDSPLKKQTHK